MRIPVFVSCPTKLNRDQDRSRDRIIRELARLQLEPRALGRSDYPSDCPLREVYVIAKHCSGGIILGFRQFSATAGVWKPGTREQRALRRGKPEAFPSPWDHLEAGILFGLQLPLLIFREEPIRGGVFDDGVTDVFIHAVPKGDIAAQNLDGFREVLLDFGKYIEIHRRQADGSWLMESDIFNSDLPERGASAGVAASIALSGADAAAMARAREDWIEAMHSGRIDGLVEAVTADTLAFPPHEAAIEGAEATRAWHDARGAVRHAHHFGCSRRGGWPRLGARAPLVHNSPDAQGRRRSDRGPRTVSLAVAAGRRRRVEGGAGDLEQLHPDWHRLDDRLGYCVPAVTGSLFRGRCATQRP